MNKNEIKKELYKQNPTVYFNMIRMEVAYYKTTIFPEKEGKITEIDVIFEIPVSDMGNTDFKATMDAKLLNRWIVE